MFAIMLVVGIVTYLAVLAARNNYIHQVNTWNNAVERGVQEKMKMHADVAKHVKNLLVQEGFAVRSKEQSSNLPKWQSDAGLPNKETAEEPSGQTAGREISKATVVALQSGTGRIVFLGEVPDPVKGYDVFTCRLLGKDGEMEFRGAQLKGEGMRLGDLVTIRRMPSESITQKDGSTKRKNRFEVIKLESQLAAEESNETQRQASSGE